MSPICSDTVMLGFRLSHFVFMHFIRMPPTPSWAQPNSLQSRLHDNKLQRGVLRSLQLIVCIFYNSWEYFNGVVHLQVLWILKIPLCLFRWDLSGKPLLLTKMLRGSLCPFNIGVKSGDDMNLEIIHIPFGLLLFLIHNICTSWESALLRWKDGS